MNEHSFFKIRIYFTVLVTIAIGSLLAWNYTHGGVPSHHILADETLPQISNWWGGAVLPLLAWFLLYRIQKRIFSNNEDKEIGKKITNAVLGFASALIFGILLSVFFRLGHNNISGNMMLSIFPLALFVPLYRSEYLLGFVIGMTYTFGAVLPTGIGFILIAITAIIHLYIRSAILFVVSRVRNQTARMD